MSYILDALKKAAEQRDAHAPAMRRLLSPAPDTDEAPRWRLALIGGAAAFAGGVVAVWLLWPAAPVATVMPVAAPPARAAQVEPAPAVEPPAPPAPPVVRTAPPRPSPAVKAVPEKAQIPEKRPPIVRSPVTETVRPAEVLPAPPPRMGITSPPVIAAARPTPPAAGATPPPKSELSSPVKLEVIVYAEERSRRLAFINGRKYVEGDTLLDGAKIQEIQPNSVVIIEDGRRIVLRP